MHTRIPSSALYISQSLLLLYLTLTQKKSTMYISNLQHFLNEQGNIPSEMPYEGREMAGFLALIVDAATIGYPNPEPQTVIKCINKECKGTLNVKVDTRDGFIFWKCNTCREEGRISDWQKTKWDNRKL